jgi:UDP-N-acetylmuramate--alanine ligase
MIPIAALTNKKSIHFIGIGGIGMSGLAEYHLKQGNFVSGSDINESNITLRLKKLGAEIKIGHSSDNFNGSTDIVVYSSAIKKDNPELKKASELKLRTMKRAEMLGDIVNNKFLIAVSGTHGKTTTTAMVGKVLVDSCFDPLVFVGGNVSIFNGSAYRFGNGNYAVVEADEYDRSFLTLKPDVIVITSIDEDHLDVYKDLNDIQKTFKKFCEISKPGSKIIYCGDDSNITSFIRDVNRESFSYGFNKENHFKIIDFNFSKDDSNFSLENSTSHYTGVKLKMIGKHNILNSAACFASVKLMDISFESFKKSISDFTTVDRRLQLKYKNNVRVYDDYAHHPKEIESSLNGLKETFKKNRIICVFQPHLYSRTRDFYKQFALSLSAADKIILLDIYPAREEPIKGITSDLIDEELKKNNKEVFYSESNAEAIRFLKDEMKKGDIIVFQGAGDVTLLCDTFIEIINNKI